MIQISFINLITFIFLGPIFLVVLILSFYIVYRNIKNIYKLIKHHRSFKRKMADVERRKKEEGFVHKWTSIKAGEKEVHVCEETGYCPSLNGFFDVGFIQDMVKLKQEEQEYEEFRQQELKKMAEELGIGTEYMQELIERGIKIKLKFITQKIEKLKQEIESKSE